MQEPGSIPPSTQPSSASKEEIPLEYAYRLLNPGGVVLLSVGTMGGRDNLLPITWNMPVRKDPPGLALVCSREHFSYPLLALSRQFGVNIFSAEHAPTLLACGTVSGFDVGDKFERFQLEREAAVHISAPLVAQAIAHLECTMVQEVSVGSSSLIVANVLRATARNDVFSEGQWRFDRGLTLLHHLSSDRFCISDKAIVVAKR